MGRVENKVAIVTGAASGLGFAAAQKLMDEGAKVLLTDKESIKKEATKYLDIFKDHPYIFNLGHGVLPETNPKMMEYLVKTVKDY